MKILIVDDDQTIRDLLGLFLRTDFPEADLSFASNGEEALDFFKENGERLSLIITDRDMPKMDGQKLNREIKKINPALPVILITGDKIDEYLKKEFKFVFQKPFTCKKLIDYIREIIKKNQQPTGITKKAMPV